MLFRRWIPVEKRLPDSSKYDYVLVSSIMVPEGYRGVPHIAEMRRGVWQSLGLEMPMEETLSVKVTHWMPLPRNPKY